jgi:hypothetical protein
MGGPERSGREPTADQVLAALDRAARHRPPRPGPVAARALREHLGIAAHSSAARVADERVAELERAGLLTAAREHGVPVWSLSERGAAALARAGAQSLPESPRHRAWRHARTAAEQELPRFAASLAAALAEAEHMLEQPPSSARWLELGARLGGECRRLGSAWHCLREWPEPDDEALDPDAAALSVTQTREGIDARRARLAGLRNVRLWREPD